MLNPSSICPPPHPMANTYNIYFEKYLANRDAKASAGSSGSFSSVLEAATGGSDGTIHSFLSELGVEVHRGKGNVITLDDLRKAAERLEKKVHQSINDLFARNGIDTTEKITLRINDQGYVVTKDDCKDKRKIDAAFLASPELSNDIRGLSILRDLIRAGEEATKGKTTARLDFGSDRDEDQRKANLKRGQTVQSIFEMVLNNSGLSIKG